MVLAMFIRPAIFCDKPIWFFFEDRIFMILKIFWTKRTFSLISNRFNYLSVFFKFGVRRINHLLGHMTNYITTTERGGYYKVDVARMVVLLSVT